MLKVAKVSIFVYLFLVSLTFLQQPTRQIKPDGVTRTSQSILDKLSWSSLQTLSQQTPLRFITWWKSSWKTSITYNSSYNIQTPVTGGTPGWKILKFILLIKSAWENWFLLWGKKKDRWSGQFWSVSALKKFYRHNYIQHWTWKAKCV